MTACLHIYCKYCKQNISNQQIEISQQDAIDTTLGHGQTEFSSQPNFANLNHQVCPIGNQIDLEKLNHKMEVLKHAGLLARLAVHGKMGAAPKQQLPRKIQADLKYEPPQPYVNRSLLQSLQGILERNQSAEKTCLELRELKRQHLAYHSERPNFYIEDQAKTEHKAKAV